MVNSSKKKTNRFQWVMILTIIAGFPLLNGCTLGFKTPAIGKHPDEKTIFIPQFDNTTGLGTSDMQAIFTEKAKDYFQQYGKFELTDNQGDCDVEMICNITGYKIPAVNASGNSSSNLSKLEITVSVSYIRHRFPKAENNFKSKPFSFFKNFSSDDDFDSIEAELIDEIADQIIINIYNSSVGFW